MIVYRVEIEVPDARELDEVRHALAEMEMPVSGRGVVTHSGVSSRGESAVVTAEIEARSPVTAVSTVYAIVAGAAPQWRMDHAVIRVAPSSSVRLDAPAREATSSQSARP